MKNSVGHSVTIQVKPRKIGRVGHLLKSKSPMKIMDEVWTQLPNDLAWRIIDHLDAGMRRDLGRKPQRLKSVPQLKIPRIVQLPSGVNNIDLGNGVRIIFGDWTYRFTSPSGRHIYAPLGHQTS